MSSMMMERTGMVGMGATGLGPTTLPGMGPSAVQPNWMMVPRCSFKFEKHQGGMKLTCICDDTMARSMVQNLCTMLAGGMCSCYMMLNGMTVCCCNFTMGLCKCDMTDKGVVFTCTSGDAKCGEMIQSCCECMTTMLKSGCTCCVMLNNTPVCCGC
jgi:hypothetical protein